MLITYTGKNIQITDDVREMTEKKLSKLDKYFESEVKCNVVYSKFKDNVVVEITIDIPGAFIRSEETNPDLRTALDKATDVLTRQIRKHKTKLMKKYRSNESIRFENIPDIQPEELKKETDNGKIVKRKTFPVVPMSEEEAILQMELLNHSFFVFINAKTNSMNILYKRVNGGYGLLIPEE